jgi:hypothetical protein
MNPRGTLASVAAACVAGVLGAADEPGAPPLPLEEPARQKVAVREAMVSVDGALRPDLGRSVSDSLVAGFLRSGRVDVIDADARTTGPDGLPLPPVEAGRDATCDFVFVPTLVGEGGFYRLTVRQLAIPSGRVEQIFEETASGETVELFALASRMATRLAPAAPRAPAPVPSGPIRAWMSGPGDLERDLAEAPAARRPLPSAVAPTPGGRSPAVVEPPPPPLRTIVLANDRRLEIEEIGRVVALNRDYSFCVIDAHPGRRLERGDRVLLAARGGPRPTVTAVVTRLERGRAIADFAATPEQEFEDGARVYKWVPEAETDGTPGIPAVPEPVPLR